MKKLISRWYLFLVPGFLLFAGLVFVLCGEDSIIAVHDNLDLFIPQYQMMKDTGTFWAHGVPAPFLGGVSRDTLPSEFSLSTILYMLLPAYPAYVACYFLKLLIAIFSCILLAKDLYGRETETGSIARYGRQQGACAGGKFGSKLPNSLLVQYHKRSLRYAEDRYESYRPLVWALGLAYGALNVFPAFGIPFASIPLVIFLVRRICKEPAFKWYGALFFYPLLSYFSYFGLFILAYMTAALIWLWVKERRFPARLLLAVCVLAAGCAACEYRLFGTMLFSDEVTIRSTMEAGSFTAGEIGKAIADVFARGMFHAESVHTYLVLPVCILYFFYLNITYIREKNGRGIFSDLYNLLMLVLLFNSVVYGVYYWEGFRGLVEALCPPLTGWQFNRTVFFSPFLWYAAFFLVLKRLYDAGGKPGKVLADLLALGAVLVVVFSGTRYNDLYHTCLDQAYRIVKGGRIDQMSFGEFYSEELFRTAKEDMGYEGEWSAAYGFYPAVLEYNGIATLDGYLGFYSQAYKEAFRKVIAPALSRVPESREYFDTWGARAYLYSGTDISIVSASRNSQAAKQDIYIDIEAFKALGGRYIFSRLELANAEEAGLREVGVYTHEDSVYTLYVYRADGV